MSLMMKIKKIVRLPKTITLNIVFIFKNIYYARNLLTIQPDCYKNIMIRPCTYNYVKKIVALSRIMCDTRKLNFFDKIFLSILGQKICFVLTSLEDKNEIIGYSIYYFNRRDILEGTIHRGYIGVLPEYRGKGIGKNFNYLILEHFAKCSKIRAVSSRVSLNNMASMKMHINSGFLPIEHYYDFNMKEEREYLICDLTPYRMNTSLL